MMATRPVRSNNCLAFTYGKLLARSFFSSQSDSQYHNIATNVNAYCVPRVPGKNRPGERGLTIGESGGAEYWTSPYGLMRNARRPETCPRRSFSRTSFAWHNGWVATSQ